MSDHNDDAVPKHEDRPLTELLAMLRNTLERMGRSDLADGILDAQRLLHPRPAVANLAHMATAEDVRVVIQLADSMSRELGDSPIQRDLATIAIEMLQYQQGGQHVAEGLPFNSEHAYALAVGVIARGRGRLTDAAAPGSDLAVYQGCSCPIVRVDKLAGAPFFGGHYLVSESCPVHAPAANRE